MHKVDESFKRKSEQRKLKKARRAWIKVGLFSSLTACLAIGVVIYSTLDMWSVEGWDNELVPIESEISSEENVAVQKVFAPTVISLPGDPLIIRSGSDVSLAAKGKTVPVPQKTSARFRLPDSATILVDDLISTSQQFMATVPSSQEDFRFYQVQRSIALNSFPDSDTSPSFSQGEAATPIGSEAVADGSAGWGEELSTGKTELNFKATEIEDNTHVTSVRREDGRFRSTFDSFVKISIDQPLEAVLTSQNFDLIEAQQAQTLVADRFGINALTPGYVVAMRGIRLSSETNKRLVGQISLYNGETFVGTIARSDENALTIGSDPWVKQDLFDLANRQTNAKTTLKYRLLDAIYSAGIRNGVPQTLVGQTIHLLSKDNDLSRFAEPGERLIIVYGKRPAGADDNQTSDIVLYAGIHSDQPKMQCFVLPAKEGKSPTCGTESLQSTISSIGGMVIPVAGVMTSKFGPRRHPVLKKVRIHKGVDWAAPIGTPIVAAFDGTISYAGDGRGYGNIVRISHSDGRETRYAHLSRFAATTRMGNQVRAGQVIGYVGTTGLSTGPHLHFELRRNGRAVDPMVQTTTTLVASGPITGDSSAVEKLTNKIIRVESAGNPRAKNPLSSATGLGQFISSTWIRMMKTYRPDLARSLSRQQLLNLRFDPDISRQMVTNLAKEGESYLKRRGHQITAGRLYLAHFLGMDGAHKALSSPDSASLLSVFGSGVIKANPFLRGKNVAYVKAWAERKMRVKGTRIRRVKTKSPAPFKTKKLLVKNKDFAEFKTVIEKTFLSKI